MKKEVSIEMVLNEVENVVLKCMENICIYYKKDFKKIIEFLYKN